MIEKLRNDLEQIRSKKFHKFADLDSLIQRCLKEHGHLFPKLSINKRGSKVVYHFGVAEVSPISIEREHGSRDSIPKYFAKRILAGIDDLIAYIESFGGGC